ncbi:hypothetical protein ERJ75_001314200 [Trypanosoma vivax]|nr:hypothetical protein ERJ75_001314200 [Trypanosoma vivax]
MSTRVLSTPKATHAFAALTPSPPRPGSRRSCGDVSRKLVAATILLLCDAPPLLGGGVGVSHPRGAAAASLLSLSPQVVYGTACRPSTRRTMHVELRPRRLWGLRVRRFSLRASHRARSLQNTRPRCPASGLPLLLISWLSRVTSFGPGVRRRTGRQAGPVLLRVRRKDKRPRLLHAAQQDRIQCVSRARGVRARRMATEVLHGHQDAHRRSAEDTGGTDVRNKQAAARESLSAPRVERKYTRKKTL